MFNENGQTSKEYYTIDFKNLILKVRIMTLMRIRKLLN